MAIAFIDRINLFYKGCYDMEFTDEERVYVERAGATKTFDEVVELAIELYGLMEEKDLEKLASLPNEGNDMDFDLDDFEFQKKQTLILSNKSFNGFLYVYLASF